MKLMKYPSTKKCLVIDKVHGLELKDSYRWLEDDNDDVRKWDELQNNFTKSLLGAFEGRDILNSEFNQLLSIESFSSFHPRTKRYFYKKRVAGQNQPVLYYKDGLDGREKIAINPNAFSDDGTVALDWWYPSDDGKLIAYGKSSDGSEKSTLHIVDIDSEKLFDDRIPYTRYSSVAWLGDKSGFYYTRYPIPEESYAGDENYFPKAYFHRLGSDWKDDVLIFGDVSREDTLHLFKSVDKTHLILEVSHGWVRNDVYYKLMSPEEEKVISLVKGKDALSHIDIKDKNVYMLTNEGASHFKMLKANLDKPLEWDELIPENTDTLQMFLIVDDKLFLLYMHNASSRLKMFSLEGCILKSFELDTLGSILGIDGENNELFFSFTSFTTPVTIYRYCLSENRLEEILRVKIPFSLEGFEAKQVFYSSKDCTKVSMFIVHKKDIVLDGNNPCLLYGYGGFSISMEPYFIKTLIPFIKRGGVFAMPNLRGGSEYGEDWHRAGMLHNKQNTFDDFIAAAKWLIKNGYTSSKKLACMGGSNGGLLIGAVITQAPELFKAAVSAVPLLDMIRFPKFLIAKLWTVEYGNPEKKEDFEYLLKYSPYHNVSERAYPSVLFTTAYSDSRVHPMHARKMCALMQEKNVSDNPILLRIETKAGHGQGKPIVKIVEELTDEWSFLFWQLRIKI